jgi:hypothetical protein
VHCRLDLPGFHTTEEGEYYAIDTKGRVLLFHYNAMWLQTTHVLLAGMDGIDWPWQEGPGIYHLEMTRMLGYADLKAWPHPATFWLDGKVAQLDWTPTPQELWDRIRDQTPTLTFLHMQQMKEVILTRQTFLWLITQFGQDQGLAPIPGWEETPMPQVRSLTLHNPPPNELQHHIQAQLQQSPYLFEHTQVELYKRTIAKMHDTPASDTALV